MIRLQCDYCTEDATVVITRGMTEERSFACEEHRVRARLSFWPGEHGGYFKDPRTNDQPEKHVSADELRAMLAQLRAKS